MTRLTLASQSPRRAKILAELGVAFDVVKTDAPEVSLPHDPEGTVVANARAKLLACGRARARPSRAFSATWSSSMGCRSRR